MMMMVVVVAPFFGTRCISLQINGSILVKRRCNFIVQLARRSCPIANRRMPQSS